MKTTTRFFLTLCLFFMGAMMSWAGFKNFSAVLNNQDGTLLTVAEQVQDAAVSFGVAVDDAGNTIRVAADDASAVATISGKYHSDHGMTHLVVTVPVEGNVKISVGQCTYSGSDVVVKNSSGETVVSKSPAKACWKNDRANVTELYYVGGATTLTISGMGYCPYVAVETNDTPVSKYDITYSLGDETAQGTVPASATWTEGDTYTVPANFTLYKEGFTLTGWTDGVTTVKCGATYAPTSDVKLTPVFTKNTTSLADRKEPVTLKWTFRKDEGAPLIAVEGSGNGIGVWVTQATIAGETIDVKMDYDATSGKINNGSWTDWCQMNNGTKLTIPSAKGAVVSIEAYSAPTTTTIDGQTDYTANGNTISYTIANSSEAIDIVIGNGSYYRYVQTVLPVVESPAGGKTYTDEAATVVFAMSDKSNTGAYTSTPADGFSTVAFDSGDCEITGTANVTMTDGTDTGVKGIKFKPSGTTTSLTWLVRPAAGLTFTPTRVQGYVNRCGTDAENGIVLTARKADGTDVALGTFTAWRQGKSTSSKDYDKTAIYKYDITLTADQQAQLAGSEGFYLTSAVGVGAAKEGLFGEVTIDGKLNGTIAAVNKYTVSIEASPSEGGQVSVYPKSEEYIENDEVTLTATEAFGYDFVSWTDKAGKVVSEESKFKYTVTADETLTANFKKVNTYSIDVKVEGGANDYMVSISPLPTVVDGKNMYEEGTKVTVTASSNKILTFTNWNNGETASELTVIMNEDKTFIASYSAIDYIVGWDFIKSGASGRAADFAAADNDAVTLLMRNEAGDVSGWLDKSLPSGGYEGRPAAVNWRTGSANGDVGHWYWQTMVNASAFKDIKVVTSMVYNYNAYTTQLVEYSLDGETWETVGKINLEGAKKWADASFPLPSAANNQPKVYIRWISDKTSKVDGAASANDGIALGATFITGTAKLIDDGTAPQLVSSVPENNGTGASANGKVVLTFDEKVMLTANAKATVGNESVTPAVSGKTVICEYKGLAYSSDVTFVLYGGSVSDLTGNTLAEDITINFQTKVKPVVEKALYDFIVPNDGTITEALAAANSRGANATGRFRIFITNGSYVFDTNGTTTGGDGKTYDDPRSYLSSPYVSFIGESMEGVVITNKTPAATWDNGYGQACPLEGIGKGDVLIIQKNGHDAYFQNLTMKSSMGDAHGRDIVLQDQSNRTVFKDACLWGYQDTYVSNSDAGKFYFEGGVLRGRTDYLCGKGDVYYNGVTLQQCGTGGYLAVPSNPKKYGYVFNNCYIKKETSDVTFYLGRPWGSGTPMACFINTMMDVAPLGNGWADMSGGWPARFAEYNSYLTTGTSIDLSGRRTSWTDKEGVTHSNNPILTLDEVKAMSLANVMGQDDDWDPTELTEQASAPANVKINADSKVLTWDDNDYVLCWAVFKDGKFVTATTTNSYDVDDASVVWSVRAANEMGGLGEETKASIASAIEEVETLVETPAGPVYNLAGQRVGTSYKGVVIQNGVKYIK